MGVSENNGTPQIIHFNRVFPYKPSILGYHCTIIFGNPHINANVIYNPGGDERPHPERERTPSGSSYSK